jgi:DNA replication protein DnaC
MTNDPQESEPVGEPVPAWPDHIPKDWYNLPQNDERRREAAALVLSNVKPEQQGPTLDQEVRRLRSKSNNRKPEHGFSPMGGGSFIADLKKHRGEEVVKRHLQLAAPKTFTEQDAEWERQEVDRLRLKKLAYAKTEAGVPTKFQGVTFDVSERGEPLKIRNDNSECIDRMRRIGEHYDRKMVVNPGEPRPRVGLILTGNNGCGKTMLCCAVVNGIMTCNSYAWMDYELEYRRWEREGRQGDKPLRPRPVVARIVGITQWIQLYRSTYYGGGKKPETGDGLTQAQVLDMVRIPDLLVLDDIRAQDFPIGPKGDNARSHFFEAVDERYKESLNTIYTSNMTAQQIREHLDTPDNDKRDDDQKRTGAIFSRLAGDCKFEPAGHYDFRIKG